MADDKKVVVAKNGPYLVSGGLRLIKEISIVDVEGGPERWETKTQYPAGEKYALCRCGESANKPYCDGSHTRINFDGAETADREKYIEKAEKYTGPEVDLTDVREMCSVARFCHLSGGTWKNAVKSNNEYAKEMAIQTACNCPSGRLVVWDKKTEEPIEMEFEPSISLTEDPQAQASGPIWLKGGISFESENGEKYETRNRTTLCRCGKSKNKPLCDGSHIKFRFSDGDESLR